MLWQANRRLCAGSHNLGPVTVVPACLACFEGGLLGAPPGGTRLEPAAGCGLAWAAKAGAAPGPVGSSTIPTATATGPRSARMAREGGMLEISLPLSATRGTAA